MSIEELPISFTAETNLGNIAFTICSCGVVLVHSELAWRHIRTCPYYRAEVGRES